MTNSYHLDRELTTLDHSELETVQLRTVEHYNLVARASNESIDPDLPSPATRAPKLVPQPYLTTADYKRIARVRRNGAVKPTRCLLVRVARKLAWKVIRWSARLEWHSDGHTPGGVGVGHGG
jgi:glycerol-3-phosphate O-acyltransferase